MLFQARPARADGGRTFRGELTPDLSARLSRAAATGTIAAAQAGRAAGSGGRVGLMEGGRNGERRALVIGAGIVGVATALQLQQDGWRVTVVDPEEPGERTSSGNAGLIATHSVTPLAMPGVLRQVPRMLVDPDSPLAIRWRHLPRLLPWVAHFVRASAPARVEALSQALADMMRQ